tara:strand:+ start:222 stop:1253 length:1032 start_codon:yes stop_codon:yes gene_type:complete
MLISQIVLSTSLLVFFLFVFKKFNILKDNALSSSHKKIINIDNSPVLIGGIFLFCCMLIFISNNFTSLKIFSLLILCLGILSDRNIIHNPQIRIVIQILILIIFVKTNKLQIGEIRIEFFDSLLQNGYFNIFFTVFCLAILLNGSNFIDGLNGLATGYYLLIFSVIFYLYFSNSSIKINNLIEFKTLIICMLIFLAFNIFGKCFLGDGGAYLISFLAGYFLIKFYNLNLLISPYFIALLLWYPAFETLFSLIRRSVSKFNVSSADNLHLHHLILFYLKTKILNNYINPITSMLIIFYNLIIFIISLNFVNNSKIIIILILANILNYVILYNYLSKLNTKNFKS